MRRSGCGVGFSASSADTSASTASRLADCQGQGGGPRREEQKGWGRGVGTTAGAPSRQEPHVSGCLTIYIYTTRREARPHSPWSRRSRGPCPPAAPAAAASAPRRRRCRPRPHPPGRARRPPAPPPRQRRGSGRPAVCGRRQRGVRVNTWPRSTPTKHLISCLGQHLQSASRIPSLCHVDVAGAATLAGSSWAQAHRMPFTRRSHTPAAAAACPHACGGA